MPKKLNFARMEEPAEARWASREPRKNATVQMSLRMREDVYERFRALCERQRRTNGEMLEILLSDYLVQRGMSGKPIEEMPLE